MKFDNKRFISLLLALVMIFTLAACGGSGTDAEVPDANEEPKHERVHMGNKVNSPAKTKYMTVNGLEFTQIDTYADGTEKQDGIPSSWEYLNELTPEEQAKFDFDNIAFQGSYCQISGLKDKELEASINERIRNLYMENLDRLPPYRGIKALLGDNPQPIRQDTTFPTLFLTNSFTHNNILSIHMGGYRVYTDQSGTYGTNNPYIYLNFIETMNIDLNTGEEIPIEVLFCDDVDGLEYLTEFVKKELEKGDYEQEDVLGIEPDLRLIGTFEGIKPDQKYYINQSGLVLIFDYETPELSGDFAPQTVYVPFTEDFAITDRFYSADENIYETEEPREKYLIGSGLRPEDALVWEVNSDYDDMIFQRRAVATEDIPEVIKDKMVELSALDYDKEYAEMTARVEAENTTDAAFDSLYMSVSNYVNSYVAGNYATITREIARYINANHGTWGDPDHRNFGWNEHAMFYEVYDLREDITEDTKPLELDDIFKEGVDYETIIKDDMKWQANQCLLWVAEEYEREHPGEKYVFFCEGSPEKVALDEKYLDELYHAATGFSLSSTQMSLTYPDYNTSAKIFEEVYGCDPYNGPEGYELGRYTNSLYHIPYIRIGYDNLVIFD